LRERAHAGAFAACRGRAPPGQGSCTGACVRMRGCAQALACACVGGRAGLQARWHVAYPSLAARALARVDLPQPCKTRVWRAAWRATAAPLHPPKHTRGLTRPHTHTHTYAPAHAPAHAHTRTHAHSHTHAHTRMHTHARHLVAHEQRVHAQGQVLPYRTKQGLVPGGQRARARDHAGACTGTRRRRRSSSSSSSSSSRGTGRQRPHRRRERQRAAGHAQDVPGGGGGDDRGGGGRRVPLQGERGMVYCATGMTAQRSTDRAWVRLEGWERGGGVGWGCGWGLQ
jgi:hypothetical protein